MLILYNSQFDSGSILMNKARLSTLCYNQNDDKYLIYIASSRQMIKTIINGLVSEIVSKIEEGR